MTEMPPWPWSPMLADARDWVAADDDPGARWLLLTGVLDRPDDDDGVRAAHAQMLADPLTTDLLDRLTPWDSSQPLSGHNSPAFAPNLLTLLADRGLRTGDDRRVDGMLAEMTRHADHAGRLATYSAPRTGAEPVWGTLLCDTHAIVDVLLRYGVDPAGEPGLARALDAMAADLTETAQGRAWPCLPDPATGWRGPGRRGDLCPQVTLEALRAFARLPDDARPPGLLAVARVALSVWIRRAEIKPYMFGHGRTFKTTKWPVTWYGAQLMVDALGRWPGLWRGPDADPADRRALAEVVACLIAYNTDDDGRGVPRSTFRGFEQHSFGQKKHPSAFATAALLTVLHRVEDLAADVAAIDVTALTSSKGGAGTALPPRAQRSPAQRSPAQRSPAQRSPAQRSPAQRSRMSGQTSGAASSAAM